MIRVIAVFGWFCLAAFGILVFCHKEANWTWRGSEKLPKNYRLWDDDLVNIQGSGLQICKGRYVKRDIFPAGSFGSQDLASSPEIKLDTSAYPVLVPLSKQASVASSLNADVNVAIWNGTNLLLNKARISALLCRDASAQPADCQAVLLIGNDLASMFNQLDPAKLTILRVTPTRSGLTR